MAFQRIHKHKGVFLFGDGHSGEFGYISVDATSAAAKLEERPAAEELGEGERRL